MFGKWDKRYVYAGATAIVVLIVWRILNITIISLDQIAGGLGVINSALAPVYIGLIIAYLLDPVMIWMEKHMFLPLTRRLIKKNELLKKSVARGASVFVSIVLGLLIIIGLFMLVLPEIIKSLTTLVNQMPSYYHVLREWISKLNEKHPEIAQYALSISQKAYVKLITWLEQDLLPSSTEILVTVSDSLLVVFKRLFDGFVGIIISIYLLTNKETFLAQARKLTYSIFSTRRANSIMELTGEMNELFGKFISGKLLDSLIVGVITFFVMNIFGIPYASLISVIIGVTNIIPFFGQYIGIIPSAFLVLLVSPLKCIIFLTVIIIIMQIDGNIIGPKILGESIGLGSFWILFSILLFGSLFGLLGMVIAVPVFAVCYRGVKKWSASRLKKKQLPSDTTYYKENKKVPINKED